MRRILVLLCVVFPAVLLSGQEAAKPVVELQFFRQTYRLNEPIPVQIRVVNQTEAPYRFSVSSLIYETFFFKIRSPKNEEILLLDPFQVEMRDNASSGGDNREVTILPGEAFSRVIDITQWFDIRDAGYYYIQGQFFPNPDLQGDSIESFYYKILIKPPALVENNLRQEEQTRREMLENVRKLPPYDVIADMIDAKQKKDWERFLSHMDLERLIYSFGEYRDAYESARSGRYKIEVLEDFKRYLTVHWQDRILSFNVVESQIRSDKATVICDVEFKVRLYSYTLRYTFSLYRNHEDVWLVNDYTALKLK